MFNKKRNVLINKSGVLMLLCFLRFINLFSQNNFDTLSPPTKNTIVIEEQNHFGKVLKIYPTFPKVDNAFLGEINIGLQTTGKKEWNQLYCYPKIGFAFVYGYLGNNKALGQNFSIIPNLAFETHNQKRWTLETRFGFGLAYFTKYYNAIENQTNNLIGSSITDITFISLDLKYKLTKHITINAGIAGYHCSNGHYQLPNIGANIPCVNFGLSYSPKIIPPFYKHDSITKPNKKVLLNIMFGYGRHEFGSATKPTGGPKYPVFQGGLYISKRFNKINNFHAGLFFSYYTDYYDFIVNQEFFETNQKLNACVATVFLGHEFIIGKFGLATQCGVNVYTPFLSKLYKVQKNNDLTSVYIANKIGIQYYFFEPTLKPRHNIYLGIYLKANFGSADYAQTAIGYTF